MCVEYIYHITGWSNIFPVIIIGEHIIQGLCDIWRYLDGPKLTQWLNRHMYTIYKYYVMWCMEICGWSIPPIRNREIVGWAEIWNKWKYMELLDGPEVVYCIHRWIQYPLCVIQLHHSLFSSIPWPIKAVIYKHQIPGLLSGIWMYHDPFPV